MPVYMIFLDKLLVTTFFYQLLHRVLNLSLIFFQIIGLQDEHSLLRSSSYSFPDSSYLNIVRLNGVINDLKQFKAFVVLLFLFNSCNCFPFEGLFVLIWCKLGERLISTFKFCIFLLLLFLLRFVFFMYFINLEVAQRLISVQRLIKTQLICNKHLHQCNHQDSIY